MCVTSNLLPIKHNGAQRYHRDRSSNSPGALRGKFESSPSNCGLSERHTHTLQPLHPRDPHLSHFLLQWAHGREGERRTACGGVAGEWIPLHTPLARSHVRSRSWRYEMRVTPPSRFISPSSAREVALDLRTHLSVKSSRRQTQRESCATQVEYGPCNRLH